MDPPTTTTSNKRPPDDTKPDPETDQDPGVTHPSAKKPKPNPTSHHNEPGRDSRTDQDADAEATHSSGKKPEHYPASHRKEPGRDPKTDRDTEATHSSDKEPKHNPAPAHSKSFRDRDRRRKPDNPTRSYMPSAAASSSSSSNQEKVTASHILIKHEGSRRKHSWKDPDGVVISATTRSEAAEQLQKIREEIVSGKIRFEEAAAEHSDCSSRKHGGDLGSFKRGRMQKSFEEAAFALKVGEMSGIVDTDSGVHIILRTA